MRRRRELARDVPVDPKVATVRAQAESEGEEVEGACCPPAPRRVGSALRQSIPQFAGGHSATTPVLAAGGAGQRIELVRAVIDTLPGSYFTEICSPGRHRILPETTAQAALQAAAQQLEGTAVVVAAHAGDDAHLPLEYATSAARTALLPMAAGAATHGSCRSLRQTIWPTFPVWWTAGGDQREQRRRMYRGISVRGFSRRPRRSPQRHSTIAVILRLSQQNSD